MPKRTDLNKILLIGSGPIVIGQACEFDYSGTQALQALKEEGYSVILVNSNPATIMTDPQLSDKVYVEPLTVDSLDQIIQIEKPDAILPTMGGQTALNLTLELHRAGILEKYGVEILGAKPDVIHRAEDRDEFKATMDQIGIKSARSAVAKNKEDGKRILNDIGLPLILRPSFTLGGEGGGSASTEEEFFEKLERALFLSPTNEVLVEESLLGWKEFELEVVRDHKDNVIIVCSIENLDPMGVHTGDSITVAPAQTLTDREYQNLRDQSIQIIRAIGVETGGSNIQFSVNPKNGDIVCIEMNPRVSRSSALASKATGFPIARVATKLAVGYTLDELTNDITKSTPCSFEPSIDYVVTKIPRFDFEKFKPTEPTLSTQMKSVGEVMAIGRSFEESLGKALAGLEIGTPWLAPLDSDGINWSQISNPHPKRLRTIADAIRKGATLQEICDHSKIDPWFVQKLFNIISVETLIKKYPDLTQEEWIKIKSHGWTDFAISRFLKKDEIEIRNAREKLQVYPAYQSVDTCAAEFEADTPYLYSTYKGEDESVITDRKKIMILGGGPNRIGQGIEFDYCCVHAAMALSEVGYETIMVNSNPETVSTDFDVSDKLYFEPLTTEHVLNIARREKPEGVIVQFGGQTPLKIAKSLEENGLKILGTSTDSIDMAEDRERCEEMIRDLKPLGLLQPPAAMANTRDEAIAKANELGYPVLVRPSYVLGGQGMKIAHSEETLKEYIDQAILLSNNHPVLIDRFLNKATEVDVDAISDGNEVFIGGIMEHIEEAGVHSGDSACSIPPATLSNTVTERLRSLTRELAKKLNVIGLMNVQYAILDGQIFLLEVNPRASRTVPFVSKATGSQLAKLAAKVIAGQSLKELGVTCDLDLDVDTFNVKAPVFPFNKFPKVDTLLGPEMKSTGEVMGKGRNFAEAYSKALLASGIKLPKEGAAFLSIRDEDKTDILFMAFGLKDLGFELYATHGTAKFFRNHGLEVTGINKVAEGSPHCVDAILDGTFSLIINTTSDEQAIKDSFSIRRAALEKKIPYTTVLSAARFLLHAIREGKKGRIPVISL